MIRPGRLGVHVEVGLPDEVLQALKNKTKLNKINNRKTNKRTITNQHIQSGRRRIISVHTRGLEESKMLASDVNLDRLAQVTTNFTGAEIEMLIQNASSYSLNRKVLTVCLSCCIFFLCLYALNIHALSSSSSQINPETMQPTKSKEPITVTMSDFVHALDQVYPSPIFFFFQIDFNHFSDQTCIWSCRCRVERSHAKWYHHLSSGYRRTAW